MEDELNLKQVQPADPIAEVPLFNINEAGYKLFSKLFTAMQNDKEAHQAFDEAEASFLAQHGTVLYRNFQYEFTSEKGIKIRTDIFRSGNAAYGSTSITMEELDTARPYRFEIGMSEGDLSDQYSFLVGSLSNSPEAEEAFMAAIKHFFEKNTPEVPDQTADTFDTETKEVLPALNGYTVQVDDGQGGFYDHHVQINASSPEEAKTKYLNWLKNNNRQRTIENITQYPEDYSFVELPTRIIIE